MATYTKQKLSGSTNGKAIKIVATSASGTTIHTAVTGTSDWDEIWLYGYNSDAGAVDLTLEWGSASAPDDNIKCTLPPLSGLQLIVPGLLLQNTLVVKAFASASSVVTINGFANRISA
jgi:hypothetical protein